LAGFISFENQEVNDLSTKIISLKETATVNLKEADRQRKIADQMLVDTRRYQHIAEEEKERANILSADLQKCKKGR